MAISLRSRTTVKRSLAATAAAAVVLASMLLPSQAAGDAADPTSVTLVGDLQSELGCASDWAPACDSTHLTKTGDQAWSAEFQVPAGSWNYKIAIDDGWDTSYGLNGGVNDAGANIPLTIGGPVTLRFTFDNTTHRTAVTPVSQSGGYTPADDALVTAPVRQAGSDNQYYFVMTDRFADANPANDTGGLTGDRLTTGYDPTSKGFYEGGDLAGLSAKLDYIKGLGTTAIWLTPSFKNQPVQGPPGSESAGYHGYWITDFTQIDPHLGTNSELTDLISAAHAKGMKVFFDIIANHTADVIDYQQKTYDYVSQAADPYVDVNDVVVPDIGAVANGEAPFPTFDTDSFPYTPVVPAGKENVKVPAWLNDPTLYHNRGNAKFDGTESDIYGDFSGLDDLMTENPAVEKGFEDIYNAWVDFGVDGFRIDTVKHVNTEFWQDWTPAVAKHATDVGNDDFFMFGEVYSGDPAYTSSFMRNGAQEAVLDFPFQGAAVSYASGTSSAKTLSRLFANDARYTTPTTNVTALPTFLGNHDMGRVGYFLANSAAPEDRDRMAHELMFFARGNPVVYYGDEQGFAGIGGDQSARQSLFASQVDEYVGQPLVDGTSFGSGDHYSTDAYLYQRIAELAKVRAAHPGLATGAQIELYANDGPGVYAFARVDPTERVEYLVTANNTATASTATFSTLTPGATYTPLYGQSDAVVADADGKVTVSVPATSVLVLEADRGVAAMPADASFTVTAPTPGAAVDGVAAVTAAGTDNRWSETSFAGRVLGSSTWIPLGTAESDTPTVYADVSGYAPGTIVEVRAVSVDAAGVRRAASTYASVKNRIDGSADTPPPPKGPDSVTVAGDFNSEIGCPGDWQPDCGVAHLTKRPDGFWSGTFSIPPNSQADHYEYKVAINDSWAENYGAGGVANGANIHFTVPAGDPVSVTFYYDPVTHQVQNTLEGPIVTLPGSYNSEVGCSGDWQPDCLVTWMHPTSDPNVLTYTATIPPGNYEFKVAHGLSWTENYGAGGAPDGANIALDVADDTPVTFSYDLTTHLVTVSTSPPTTTTLTPTTGTSTTEPSVPSSTPEPTTITETPTTVPEPSTSTGTPTTVTEPSTTTTAPVTVTSTTKLLAVPLGSFLRSVLLVAVVQLDNGQPAQGSVALRDNGVAIATVPVRSGVAVALVPAGPGAHQYVATYVPADPTTVAGSSSPPVRVGR